MVLRLPYLPLQNPKVALGRGVRILHLQNHCLDCGTARPFPMESGGAQRRLREARISFTSSFWPHMMKGLPSNMRPALEPQNAPPHWLQRSVSGSWPRRSDSSSSSFLGLAFMGRLYRVALSHSKSDDFALAIPSEPSPSHGKRGDTPKTDGFAVASPFTSSLLLSKPERMGACA